MRDQLLDLTSKLISIASVTSDIQKCEEIIEYISSWAKENNLIVKKFNYNNRPSLMVTLTEEKPKLIFNGHVDVVPANPDQFNPKIQDNKLIARGAQDMKSGIAAMLQLVADLKKQGSNNSLGVMVVTDEEIGGFDGSKKLLNDAGYKPEFLIAGESTDLKIEYQAKGISWIKVKAQGKRAHGAYLWEGQNAIRKLVQELESIGKLYPEPKQFIWETTCNIGKINGGLANNQVPGEAEAVLDFRRIPTETTQDIVDKLKSSLVYSDTSLEIIFDEPSHSTLQDHPFVQLLAASVSNYTNKPAEFIQKCGASDARHFSVQSVPSVCFGPTGDGLHTDNEYLDIDSLEIFYNILQEFTKKFFQS